MATPGMVAQALSYASRSAWDRVEHFICAGVDVNGSNSQGLTMLHYAAGGLHGGHLPTLTSLLHRGALVNAVNRGGNTPLHWAVVGGSLPIVHALLAAGANVNAVNLGCETPLVALAWDTSSGDSEARRLEELGIAAALVEVPHLDLGFTWEGMTAEGCARARGRTDLANLLSQQAAARVRWSPLRRAWIAAVVTVPPSSSLPTHA